ncbi:MAG: flavodoxin family protein [Prolixibacteraceae bacterium]|nr:flavodoxin family protein [Prolixibacteraceae bacterium]
MKKFIVVYYSRTGNNEYLAKKIASQLDCDIEKIMPRVNSFIFFLLNISLGIKKIKHDVAGYENIILCGPIMMGRFLSPLHDFYKKYKKSIKKLYFVTCCGSGFKVKDDKFGHATVFKYIKGLMGEKLAHCEALPVGLTLPAEKQDDGDAIMKARLSDENFKDEIEQHFNQFIEQLKRETKKRNKK